MKVSTLGFATAAAVIATSGVVIVAPAQAAKAVKASAGDKVVHCYGINTCKGTSDCATAKTECKGQNECKGQGFKALTTSACKAAGGSLTEAK
ncbi:MAG TPA: hypothetical protein VL405_02965 [Sphingomonas sp.]|jgi:hypothetical protein|nr:hypothetical protein [Sphingomonas sp.]